MGLCNKRGRLVPRAYHWRMSLLAYFGPFGPLLAKLFEFLKNRFFTRKQPPGGWTDAVRIRVPQVAEADYLKVPKILQRTLKHDAYEWACQFTALTMFFSYLRGTLFDLTEMYLKCSAKGRGVRATDAFISSHNKVAQDFGYPELKWRSQKLDFTLLRDLIRSGKPVIVYLYNPVTNKMSHVEICVGYEPYRKDGADLSSEPETLFNLIDPGWREHTHFGGDGVPFHMNADGSRRTNNRVIRWMGWYA